MFKHAILCNHRYGQKKFGVENAPKLLANYINPKTKIHNINEINLKKSLTSIYRTNEKLIGSRVNIGGDHSISIATGAYTLNKNENTKFIWIDAHPDINTYKSSTTKNVHGMPLGYLTGLNNIPKVSFIQNRLPFSNLLYIGIRDIDEYEYKIIRKKQINHITSTLCNNNVKSAIEKINTFVNNSPVHLSFDVDSIDPKYVASTGTPVCNGLKVDIAKKLVQHIVHNKEILNIDICELNPSIGSNEDAKESLHNVLHVWEGIL